MFFFSAGRKASEIRNKPEPEWFRNGVHTKWRVYRKLPGTVDLQGPSEFECDGRAGSCHQER